MFNFFKKKEKPVHEYSMVEIGSKALFTQEYSYMPTEITYYQDRIEFCINLFNNKDEENFTEFTPVTVSVALTDERLLPFEIEGVQLFWDTKDMAFRKKVMPEGEAHALIPQVLIYPNEVMTIEREFAERYLSTLALSYATLHDDRYIWYYPDGSASPAVFEIPRLFRVFDCQGENNMDRHPLSSHPIELGGALLTYTPSYLEENGLTTDNFLTHLSENMKHGKSTEQSDE